MIWRKQFTIRTRINRFHTIAAITVAALLTTGANAQITPIEITELIPADGAADDYHGTSVAIDGDYAIVGSRWDDDFANAAGSAYIYRRSENGEWVQQIKLLTNAGHITGRYADKVAISGDTAVVSAYGETENGIPSGKVYIYQRDAFGFWTLNDIITPDDAFDRMQFGKDIAIDGDNLIVGATGAFNPGSAYIFTRDEQDNWTQHSKLTPNGANEDPSFGYSVDIDGDTAIIGAITDDGSTFNTGSVYMFRYQNAGPFVSDTWIQQAKLNPDFNGLQSFGWDVSVDDESGIALVGAIQHWIDVNNRNVGAAYFFERGPQNIWTKTSFVLASDPIEQAHFGYSVAIDGNFAVISATQSFTDTGAAYIFMPDAGGDWTQQAKLVPDDAILGDRFGYSVSLDCVTAFVGAPNTDDLGNASGSSYLFDLHPCFTDINFDGLVDTADLGLVLGAFSTDDPVADLNDDGIVNTADLGLLIGAFGPCPLE